MDSQETQIELSKGQFQSLNNFILLLRDIQEKDMDAIVPVTGFKGVGKSTLALHLARNYIQKFMPSILPIKDMHRYIVYTNDAVMMNLLMEEDYLPLICDEAVEFIMGEDWMRAESKKLKKRFVKIRPKHRLIFPCIPDFFWIDRKYREDMIHFWIHIVGRGTAIIFTSDMKIGVKDKWHRKEFEGLKGNINMFTPVENVIKIYKKHPCFFDIISFDKVDKNYYEKYMSLREHNVERVDVAGIPMAELIIYCLMRRGIKKYSKSYTFGSSVLSEILVNPRTNMPLFTEKQLDTMARRIDAKLSSEGMILNINNNKAVVQDKNIIENK